MDKKSEKSIGKMSATPANDSIGVVSNGVVNEIYARFDSCVILEMEAADLASHIQRQLDTARVELEGWKYLALKCNPNARVSKPQKLQ